MTVADLCAVHDAAFVQGVLAGRVHSGFGNRRADVARWLPFTSGALLGETGGGRTDGVERSGLDAAGMVRRTGFV